MKRLKRNEKQYHVHVTVNQIIFLNKDEALPCKYWYVFFKSYLEAEIPFCRSHHCLCSNISALLFDDLQYNLISEVRSTHFYLTPNNSFFKSNFPFDIYDEISEISFSKFNHQSGSYQRIIPSVANYFAFGKKVGSCYL